MKKPSSYRQPIGDSVYQNLNFLKSLKSTSIKKQQRLLRLATFQELLTLIEIAFNIIKSRFKLTGRQKNKLTPYVNFVRKLGRARSEKGARNILQKGSGIPLTALITPILIESIRYLATKI